MIELSLKQRPDKTVYYEVKVRSEVKPYLKCVGIVEHKEGDNNIHRVGLLAGALAEQLCEKYDDTLDPGNVYLTCVEFYRQMMSNPQVQPGNELPRDADKYIGVARK